VSRIVVAACVLSASIAHADRLGLMIDVGLPDGASLAVAYQPDPRLRMHAGASHNTISGGGRVGLTLAPIRSFMSPTLSLDVGRFAKGDANPLVRAVSGDEMFDSPLIERLGYSYANAQVGLQWGGPRTVFYVQGGISYVAGTLRDLESASSMVTFEEDPRFAVWTPSLRLGLVVFVL